MHITFFYEFYMVCIFQPLNIQWETSVQALSTRYDLPPFGITETLVLQIDFMLENIYDIWKI